ncbi:Rid family hydrolase [Novosphingobium sp.]|uniref:Rid family hydrolase n=1 Tax=Novosphingobium sp. TaxID=1874826 RepID=UPI0035B0797B
MSELPMETANSSLCEAREMGGWLFCSGQIGLNPDGTVPADPAAQFDAAFAALTRVLEQHGCTMQDVADLTSFHVGYPAHMDLFMASRAKAMTGAPAAWTAIGVAALGYPGSLVEVKAIARLPELRADLTTDD